MTTIAYISWALLLGMAVGWMLRQRQPNEHSRAVERYADAELTPTDPGDRAAPTGVSMIVSGIELRHAGIDADGLHVWVNAAALPGTVDEIAVDDLPPDAAVVIVGDQRTNPTQGATP